MTICDQNDNPHPNARLMLDVADCQQVPAEVHPSPSLWQTALKYTCTCIWHSLICGRNVGALCQQNFDALVQRASLWQTALKNTCTCIWHSLRCCRNVGAICQQNSDALKLVQDSSNGQPLTDSSKLNTCIWMLVTTRANLIKNVDSSRAWPDQNMMC